MTSAEYSASTELSGCRTTLANARSLQRRFAVLPPGAPASMIRRFNEVTELLSKKHEACDNLAFLLDDARDLAAYDDDRRAASAAVRSGRPASSVGSPAVLKLAGDRADLEFEVAAIVGAIHAAEDEIAAEAFKLNENARSNGRAEVERSIVAYRRALGVLLHARDLMLADIGQATFLHRAATQHAATLADVPDGSVTYGDTSPWLIAALDAAARGRPPHDMTVSYEPAQLHVPIDALIERANVSNNYDPASAGYLLAMTFGRDVATLTGESSCTAADMYAEAVSANGE